MMVLPITLYVFFPGSEKWLLRRDSSSSRMAGYFSRNWPAPRLNIWGSETMHAEGVSDLATVMDVMFDDVPDDPSAGVGIDLAFPLLLDSRLQICERIPSHYLLHDLPGLLQSAYQFTCGARWAPRLLPLMQCAKVLIALLQVIMEPP